MSKMRYRSGNEYTSSFNELLKTVSGRATALKLVASDISKFEALLVAISRSIVQRDEEAAKIVRLIDAVKASKESYILGGIVPILRPVVAAEVKAHQDSVRRVRNRKGRIFGSERPLDQCYSLVYQLMQAAQSMKVAIKRASERYSSSLELQRERRQVKRQEKDEKTAKLLDPFRKRIELGEASLGRSRTVAALRKHRLTKEYPCPYCGGALGPSPAADHIYPVARGGLSTLDNMVYVCTPCNQKKRDFTLVEFCYRQGRDISSVHARLIQQGKRF